MVDGLLIRVLMYADDVIILADQVDILQKMINRLKEYTNMWNLNTNMEKSKKMIFQKAGRRSREENWHFGVEEIEMVNEYIGIWV